MSLKTTAHRVTQIVIDPPKRMSFDSATFTSAIHIYQEDSSLPILIDLFAYSKEALVPQRVKEKS